MKKNMMKVAFVAALAMIAGYGVNNAEQSEVMSDLMVANVEALADYAYTSLHSCEDGGLYCSLHLNGRLAFESNSHRFVFP